MGRLSGAPRGEREESEGNGLLRCGPRAGMGSAGSPLEAEPMACGALSPKACGYALWPSRGLGAGMVWLSLGAELPATLPAPFPCGWLCPSCGNPSPITICLMGGYTDLRFWGKHTLRLPCPDLGRK